MSNQANPGPGSKRDPRIDPQHGDAVRKISRAGLVISRYVNARKGNDIIYSYEDGGAKTALCFISTWQEWCRNAEVIKVGDGTIEY